MTYIQNVRFGITAINSKGTFSLDRFFLAGDSAVEINSVPSARLQFSDKNRVLSNITSGLIPPTETFWVGLSASTDSGVSWEPVFCGLAEDYNISLQPTGERTVELTLFDAPELRHNYISPNQIAIGNCDFGSLFRGTNTASDGTPWGTDSYGNYPNGLLYDTNMSYSSAMDFYSGTVDVPFRTSYNGLKKIEAIQRWLENYGLCFVVDTRNQKFYLRKLPSVEPFPFSGDTIFVGRDANQYTKRMNLADFRSSITLVGSSVFDMYGGGTKESFIEDSNILSFESARTQTRLFYSSSRNIPYDFSVTIPPTNRFFLGKGILFSEIDGSSETASVVSMQQNYDPTRWETVLTFEKPTYSIAKTIVEIQDEVDRTKQEELDGQVFVRVYSGQTQYALNEGKNSSNICAIGLGTSKDTDSDGNPKTDSGAEETILIKPILGTMTDMDDGKYMISAYTRIDPTEANRLIREVVLFANNLSGGSLYSGYTEVQRNSRSSVEWNPAHSSIIWAGGADCNDIYFSRITRVSLYPWGNYYAYPKTARELRVLYLNSLSFAPRPPDLTASDSSGRVYWESYASVPTSRQLENMSKDMAKDSEHFSVATFTNLTVSTDGQTTSSSGQPISVLFEYTLPVQPQTSAADLWNGLHIGFHSWAEYSHATGTGTLPVELFLYFPSQNTWAKWFCVGTISNQPSCSWYYLTLSPTPPSNLTDALDGHTQPLGRYTFVETDSGKVRAALYVPTNSSYPGATVSLYIQYAGMTNYVYQKHGVGGTVYDIHFEQARIDDAGRIVLNATPHQLLGIYAEAQEENGTWKKIDTATNILPKDNWGETVDFLQIWKPVPLHGKEFGRRKPRTTGGEKVIYPHEVYPYTPLYLNINDAEQDRIFRKLISTKCVFVEYNTERLDPNVIPPEDLPIDIVSASYSNRGKNTHFYLDYTRLPFYGDYSIRIDHQTVGSGIDAVHAGTVGKALFHLNPRSSIREGLDKNAYKTLNIQFDYYGTAPLTGSVDDDNAVMTLEEKLAYISEQKEARRNALLSRPLIFRPIVPI